MKYEIGTIIERLEVLKGKGKELITENELIKAAMPIINRIDYYIRKLEELHEKNPEEYIYSISELGEKITVSRRTFYRWIAQGFIKPCNEYKRIDDNNEYLYFEDNRINQYINTQELLADLKRIKKIKET